MKQEMVLKDKGASHTLPLRSPDAWTGEVDCIVGPFETRDTAEYFVDVSTGWRLDVITRHIFSSDNRWYVEAEALP